MTFANSMPLLTALVAIAGAAFAYWNQKRLDRKSDLISLRREAYQVYISAYLYNNSQAQNESLNYARIALCLVASDAVLLATSKLDSYAIENSGSELSDSSKFRNLMTLAVLRMRADVFERSSLDEKEIRLTLPFR